eukprot:scaffold86206_cov23-Prasinocladus_malaysianus.AAC.2
MMLFASRLAGESHRELEELQIPAAWHIHIWEEMCHCGCPPPDVYQGELMPLPADGSNLSRIALSGNLLEALRNRGCVLARDLEELRRLQICMNAGALQSIKITSGDKTKNGSHR